MSAPCRILAVDVYKHQRPHALGQEKSSTTSHKLCLTSSFNTFCMLLGETNLSFQLQKILQ